MRRNAAPSKLLCKDNKILKVDSDILNNNLSNEMKKKPLPSVTCDKLSTGSNIFFSVAYGKPSKKKHKTWEGDGFLSVSDSSVKLLNNEGKIIGSTFKKQLGKVIFEEGSSFYICGKFIEILSVNTPYNKVIEETKEIPENSSKKSSKSSNEFRSIIDLHNQIKSNMVPIPMNNAPLVIMPRPSAGHIFKYNQSCSQVRDVVLDPYLANRMRPHQIDGLIFLYECVLGLRSNVSTGAILADAMGLGKSVQTIALIWTLLNQGPYEIGPFIRRCVIICPSSLVLNWKNEFEKWLGPSRVRPIYVTGDTCIEKFLESSSNNVLVLSYEMLMRNLVLIQQMSFDLIICDEAHRLRNANIKTSVSVESLKIPRRILLTGTPLQNDMDEFFALAELSNPGVIGYDKEAFRKLFVNPIVLSRESNAPQEIIAHGNKMSLLLQRITKSFILRRTELVNTHYLPPKDEFLIFCRATSMQLQLYEMILSCKDIQQLNVSSTSDVGSNTLHSILLLRKLCNDPGLFVKDVIEKKKTNFEAQNIQDSSMLNVLYNGLMKLLNENELWQQLLLRKNEAIDSEICSGKLWVTKQMLLSLRPSEKIVIASHFTQTLNILERLCENIRVKYQRIDGSISPGTRMRIVNDFNNTPRNMYKEVLLLSCKAGGEGLNLIGASKILLYDLDWNPAVDLQCANEAEQFGERISSCNVF